MRLAAIAFLLLAACRPGAVAQGPTEELVTIARAEAERRNVSVENIRPPVVFDEGASWVVVLDPPPAGWKGGGTEVSIDKKSKQVLGLERGK